MSKYETKKKLLVAECEVYRQVLKLELQTFKVYTKRTKRRMTSVSAYMPLVMSGLPFLTGMFGRRKGRSTGGSSLKRMGSLILLGWKTYKRFGPLLARKTFSVRRPPADKTAAEEYLAKRL